MLNNKKGQLGLLLSPILLIPGLIILAALLIFAALNIWIISGIAIIILAISIGLKPIIENPNQISFTIFGFILLLGGSLILIPILQDSLGFSIGGDIFVKPSWARLECAPTDAYEGSYSKFLDERYTFRCDAFTEECQMKIENTKDTLFANSDGSYRICDLYSDTNCGSKISYNLGRLESTNWINIPSGKTAWFTIGFFAFGEDQTKVSLRWRPWKLYRIVGGAKWTVNSVNCNIVSSAKANIRNEDYPGLGKLLRQGGIGTKWINYVDDWNYGPATNVYDHPQYGEVYCSAGQVYDIIELEMANGNLQKVDPAYSKTLPDGDRLSGLGSRIANVECCPGEASCTKNFEYTSPENSNPSCFSDIQCYNAGNEVPTDKTHYKYQFCNPQGVCEWTSEITVECTTSAQCSDGQICDLSTTNYGRCINQQLGSYCGDKTCDLNENVDSCPSDCTPKVINCEEQGGKLIVKTTQPWYGKIPGFSYFVKEKVTERCLISHLSIFAIVLLALGFILTILAIIYKQPIVVLPGSILILIGVGWSILAGIGYV